MSIMQAPVCSDTVFIRGFSVRLHVDEIRSFFGHEAGRNSIEFVRDAQDGETILLALKFDSKGIAKEVLNRFDNTEVLGCRISVQWYRDVRKTFHNDRPPLRRGGLYHPWSPERPPYEYRGVPFRGRGGMGYPPRGGGWFARRGRGAEMDRGPPRRRPPMCSRSRSRSGSGTSRSRSRSRASRNSSRSHSADGPSRSRKNNTSPKAHTSKTKTKKNKSPTKRSTHSDGDESSPVSETRTKKKKKKRTSVDKMPTSSDHGTKTKETVPPAADEKSTDGPPVEESTDNLAVDASKLRSRVVTRSFLTTAASPKIGPHTPTGPEPHTPDDENAAVTNFLGQNSLISDKSKTASDTLGSGDKPDGTAAGSDVMKRLAALRDDGITTEEFFMERPNRPVAPMPSVSESTALCLSPSTRKKRKSATSPEDLSRVDAEMYSTEELLLDDGLLSKRQRSTDNSAANGGLRVARDDELGSNHSAASQASNPSSNTNNISSAKRTLAGNASRELGILGLPPEKVALVREKKDGIEKAYRQDCETFATVTKMLINKDPGIEDRIQFSLRENLKDIGKRCIQELRSFIDGVRADHSQELF